MQALGGARWTVALRSSSRRWQPGTRRQHRSLGKEGALRGIASDGDCARCRHRAPGPPSAGSGRDPAAAGLARRGCGRSRGDAAGRRARRHHVASSLARAPAASVGAYAKRHRLRHIVDDSNADPRFARNRLRLRVWPVLLDAFPQAEAALATSAAWAREARSCADALAAIDLAGCADARGIDIALWSQLSPSRRTTPCVPG